MSEESRVPFYQWAVLPSPPDSRDYLYSQIVGADQARAEKPRRFISPKLVTRQQGGFPTCGGQAGADAKDIREGVVTSPLYIYRKIKELDGAYYEGITLRNLMKALTLYGICQEDLYPYSNYHGGFAWPELPVEADVDAATRKIEGYVAVKTAEEVVDAIYKYGSVVAALEINPANFGSADDYISIHMSFMEKPSSTTGHAVDLVGYDLDVEYTYPVGVKFKGFVLVRNSHGGGWGNNGEAWMPLDLIAGRSDVALPKVYDMYVPIDVFTETIEEIEMDVAPFISNDRTFTPARFVAEALGAKVNWYEADQRIEIINGLIKVEMWIGEKVCRITKKGA